MQILQVDNFLQRFFYIRSKSEENKFIRHFLAYSSVFCFFKNQYPTFQSFFYRVPHFNIILFSFSSPYILIRFLQRTTFVLIIYLRFSCNYRKRQRVFSFCIFVLACYRTFNQEWSFPRTEYIMVLLVCIYTLQFKIMKPPSELTWDKLDRRVERNVKRVLRFNKEWNQLLNWYFEKLLQHIPKNCAELI